MPSSRCPEIVGSGPFKFVKDEWVPGSKIVYVKNDTDYVPRSEPASGAAGGKVVKVDRVEWVYIPDPATTMNALVNGEVDLWETPAVDMVPLLKTNPDIKIDVIDPLGTQGWMRPNHLHFPSIIRRRVRRCCTPRTRKSSSRPSWVIRRCTRSARRTSSAARPTRPMSEPDPLAKVDKEMAKKLLKEAGYNGEKIIMMQPTDIPVLNNATLVTAQMLRDIGMDVEVQAMDWSR